MNVANRGHWTSADYEEMYRARLARLMHLADVRALNDELGWTRRVVHLSYRDIDPSSNTLC
jgi:hypothetical protein